MPTLTPIEEAALESQRLQSAEVDWYLALAPYGDPTFTARVNNPAADYGDRAIIYDGDVGEVSVVPGMTLWIGSIANSNDIGKVRIRSINIATNTITVAENDHIEWADDLYLTCPGSHGFHELWGIYSRITEAAMVVTFYEDYDLTFTVPQDTIIPPKANGGPPVCGFLGDGGYIDVSFVGDESFTTEVGASIAAYLWDFADGIVQSGAVNQAGTCAIPNVVRFSSTGFRYITLTVTDDTIQARTAVIYIPVWIFDSNEMPIGIEMVSQDASPQWNTKFKVFESLDYPDGALCVIFTKSRYPDGSTDIGGSCHRSNIHFVGWLDSESLSWSIDGGTIEYSAIDHCSRLNQLPGFAYTLEDQATPTDWYMVAELNFDRAAHIHLLRRSTACEVCHIERLGEGSTRVISIQPYPDASIYAQIQEHLMSDAMSSLLCDRQGILRIRRDPQFMGTVDRNGVDIVTTIQVRDVLGQLDEAKAHQPELGYVRLGGFSYDTPLLSEAPGVAPVQSEGSTHQEGFIVTGQTELNLWTACWLCKANSPYKQVPIELNGYWPVFDPAFQEYIKVTITDPLGHNPLDNTRFIVREVEFKSMVSDGTEVTRLVVEKEAPLCSANSSNIPEPPVPPGPPPPPEPPVITIPPPEFALIHNRVKIYSTSNFDALNPTWTDITGGIGEVIYAVECDHFDGIGAWALTGTSGVTANDTSNTVGLWHTADVTIGAPVWSLVFSQFDGSDNRYSWLSGGCTGSDNQPQWGQLRSLNPVASGECIVSEARWAGLTVNFVGQTMVYKVDSVGAFERWNEAPMYAPGLNDGIFSGSWLQICGQCSDTAAAHAGAEFVAYSPYINQKTHFGCHQMLIDGYGLLHPAGAYKMVREDLFCSTPGECDCGNCQWTDPWPKHGGVSCNQYLDGATHIVFSGGRFWGQSSQDLALGNGGLYNSTGEQDSGLWSNYAFCNLCTHHNHLYYCKQINAIVARSNELFMDEVATGVRSNLLFGGSGPGYNAGVIGHIRAIWDEDQTVVLVRKDMPHGLQPNNEVVYTWDTTNGLINKTSNLSGATWYGTGDKIAGNPHALSFDNVSFSAFGVTLR